MANSASDPNVETVERFIKAPAAAIFAIVADPARHHEIDGSGTVQGVRAEPSASSTPLTLGSTFDMKMKMGLPYTMVNTVVEFEPDRVIAWQPRPDNGVLAALIGGRIWRYELTPQDGGTLVRESWDIRQEKIPAVMLKPMRKSTRESMAKTLGRLEQVVAT
jgi:uncharacterized protein YndB with AHSA1/START domain